MKNKYLLQLIFSLFATFSFAQQSTITQKVDSLLTDAFNKGIFSGQVIISKNGKEIYYKQLGFADWKTKRSIEKTTVFNIGSLNKQFTEEIIHQLVRENKLAYDDRLNKYLDLFPSEMSNKITIQQLLDMKAGLGDYIQDPSFDQISLTDFSLNELMQIIKKEPLLFDPGTDQLYSNSGYAVLGSVIEKITNKSYEANLKERIVMPLGLENLSYSKSEKERSSNRAYGTDIDFEGNKISLDDISNSTPAGGLYTSVNNLLKFTEAKLKSTLPSGIKYGNGMFAGGTSVWNSTICYNEKNGFAFVVMANTGHISDELAPRINSIIKNEQYPPLDLPFEMKLFRAIQDNGIGYVKKNAEKLADQARLPFDDRFLNYFGFRFLEGNRAEIAIDLFKMNIEFFPKNPNTYDSLAEAYLKTGDKINASKYYKIELELDPGNSRVKQTLAYIAK